MRILTILFLIGCSAPESTFGVVTEDGKAAIHEFCGPKLELSSNLHLFKKPNYTNPNLLVYYCALMDGTAWLAIDTTNGKLWDFGLAIDLPFGSSYAEFDRLVARVLLPTFDPEQRQAYDALRPTMSFPWSSRRSWIRGDARITVIEDLLFPLPPHHTPVVTSPMVVATYADSKL